MKQHLFLFLSGLSILFGIGLIACSNSDQQILEISEIAIIPQPQEVTKGEGHFLFIAATSIQTNVQDEEVGLVIDYLRDRFHQAAGFRMLESGKAKSQVYLLIDENFRNGNEAYELTVDEEQVLIRASHATGLFYGVQSLLQLLPPEIYGNSINELVQWAVPSVKIKDAPRFSYRGMHLDVCRHFFSVAEVKKYIDVLAYHKMNTFHWHLTEDQGWRIEIKKYPKLTEIGAFRNGTLVGHYSDQPHQFDGKKYGGYYTQEEVKEVVAYANERFITIIPEIEMPGHAQAAIASYPELGCTDDTLEVLQLWGVSENVYCPKESTFEFLENVLEEVMDLFPGKYIHIGGDECPKSQWEQSAFCQDLIKQEGLADEHELQSWFIARIEKFVNAKGKSIIGWDEILEGGLAPNATVMSWRGEQGGIEAAKQNHNVIMSPTTYCYLDYYQAEPSKEPLAIGGYLPLEKVYSYEPIPDELSVEESKYILGIQGNVWTEYIPTFEQVGYMAFPRASALAEIAWSPKSEKEFSVFCKKLKHHLDRLKVAGIQTANHLYELSLHTESFEGQVGAQLNTLARDSEIHFTLDGIAPSKISPINNEVIPITESTTLKAQAYLNDDPVGRLFEKDFRIHKAVATGITLTNALSPKYSADGALTLVNGILADPNRFNDGNWVGLLGADFEAIIDLEKLETAEKIQLGFYNSPGSWIYLPKEIHFYTSKDGVVFTEIDSKVVETGKGNAVYYSVVLKKHSFQYLKLVATNYGKHPDYGEPVWLFVDEIIVE